MKPLWLLGVTGLYQEFFQPDTMDISCPIGVVENNTLDSGKIFWSQLLQPDRIASVVDRLEENIQNPAHQLPQFLGILGDKRAFIDIALDCRFSLCDQGADPRTFFSKLETLSIVCELYSRFEYSPFKLTIQNGFLLNEASSRDMLHNCLSKFHNPYIGFIYETVLPILKDYNPNVIFCIGRISYFHVALTKIIKKHIPEMHVCISRHSSEYYSLNKVEAYLHRNIYLFDVFDSIVLEYYDETERHLIRSLSVGAEISNIPNLLTSKMVKTSQKAKRIPPAGGSSAQVLRRKRQIEGLSISPEKIFDIHFEPYVKCYWNKCVFCGINKKYTYHDNDEDESQTRERLDVLRATLPGGAFLWFIDEAIHPIKLRRIADYLIKNRCDYVWQARCRIDPDLLVDELPEQLARAGLKELRLGLESASIRILRLMDKFEEGFHLELVERIVERYSACGVSIHFPMIIGFPGEEASDRQKTYDYLSSIRDKFPNVTFNINIFSFDVGSLLFKNWDKYAVSEVAFPCFPADFVGNTLYWNYPDKIDTALLERERNSFMRNKLYPWMPQKTFITPAVYYRLSETIRNTLTWKSCIYEQGRILPLHKSMVRRSSLLVAHHKTDGMLLMYNWHTHHYLEGDGAMVELLNIWQSPKSIEQGIKEFCRGKYGGLFGDDIAILVKKLLSHGHLELVAM